MPDVKVRFPRMMFAKSKLYNPQTHWRMMELLATTVAEALSCQDYDDQDLILSPSGVDVHLMPYASDDVLFQGTVVLVELTGYDYPTRMRSMKLRLTKVQDVLTDFLVKEVDYSFGEKIVSVTFIPITNDCWV